MRCCHLPVFFSSSFFWPVFALLLLPIVQSDEWVCGSDSVPFSQAFTKFTSWTFCSSRVPDDLNRKCCGVHDKCYCSLKTRHQCDAEFCSCVKRQTHHDNFLCRGIVTTGCAAVRTFGAASFHSRCPSGAANGLQTAYDESTFYTQRLTSVFGRERRR
ncbi:hypothetical protein L596_011505 [Steinernema carpocapsae]|uniref:Phospholipase A2 domain-containing protein n=1 Tax=Steinernema carpocapsae TaxID=34508 RepID=A0A4U5NU36_STECR|nr:hypothetical protein L596_011505 [Steinernema carpocapsae]